MVRQGPNTWIVAVAERLSTDAVIEAAPSPTAVTRPLLLTVAMVVLVDVQEIVRFVTMLLAASRSVAVSWTVSPTSKVSLVGATVILAIGGGMTSIVAIPLFEPLAAVITAVPSVCAVTSPDDETDATLAADEDHVTG